MLRAVDNRGKGSREGLGKGGGRSRRNVEREGLKGNGSGDWQGIFYSS